MIEKSTISATTRYCAVYGYPVKHSASPAMQNAGIAELELDWRYLAFEVAPENLREAIRGAGAMGFIGLNLTVPHKLLVMEMMDDLDESARKWGAVNTVLFETRGGEVRTRGFNTDADAIGRAIEEDLGMKLAGASVLLLGAGGAGRTAALKLASAGVQELFLVNRTASKAEEVAAEIHKERPEAKLKLQYPEGKVDLVLNATSLGLQSEDALPFEPGRFSLKKAGAAYDMIYRPAETKFLQEAKAAGCKTANGLGMLLYQGAKALEIWSGQNAPVETMRKALHEHVYRS